jgi:ABC-type dipeptide/oligopeptide/nickel transport system ATPase subunit
MLTFENITKKYSMGIRKKKEVLVNLSFKLKPGQITGLLGPSGSGKSTLGRLALRLEKPDQGRVLYNGLDIWKLNRKELQRFHQKVQMVPQHPDSAFNPRLKIGTSMKEMFRFHEICPVGDQNAYLTKTLSLASVHPELLSRYPAQLSGGEIQRLAIARALLAKPDTLILDEVTSMLDISVQAAVIRTLQFLHRQHDVSYLFITHNASLARAFCHTIFVLNNGKLNRLSVHELPGELCGNAINPGMAN